jgi:predicted nucleic acid-binding protein
VILLVPDASVAVKWILRGPQELFVPQAWDILLQHVEGKIQLTVPDLFWVEMGNVLGKAVRRGRCTKATAFAGLRELKQQSLLTAASGTLVEAALEIALQFDRTVYDSVYVALAQQRGAQLITADERLANALAAHYPVKWLGSI